MRGRTRGRISESRVAEALNAMRESQRRGRNRGVPTVVSFVHAIPNSAQDIRCADFSIELAGGAMVDLQVKSSKERRAKFLKDHPDFPCVVVSLSDTIYDLMMKIKKEIRHALAVARERVIQAVRNYNYRVSLAFSSPKDRYINRTPCFCH